MGDVHFNTLDENFNFGVKLRQKICKATPNLFQIIHICHKLFNIVQYLIRSLKSQVERTKRHVERKGN